MSVEKERLPASFPVVLGDFGYDVTCEACRENSPGTASSASSGHSDSANRPGYEAERLLSSNGGEPGEA